MLAPLTASCSWLSPLDEPAVSVDLHESLLVLVERLAERVLRLSVGSVDRDHSPDGAHKGPLRGGVPGELDHERGRLDRERGFEAILVDWW